MDEDLINTDNDAGYTLGGNTDTSDVQATGDSVNLEGGDLGQTEAQAQDDFYKSIGLDPTTIKDTSPATQAQIDAIINGDAYRADPGLIQTVLNAFKTTKNGKTTYDWDKVGVVGGLLAKATGLSNVTIPGYKGTVKQFTAVNAPIKYDDTNRRPGSMGRDYFTPTQFVAPGDAAAAQQTANTQAAGIMAALPRTPAPTSRWDTKPAVAMPWQTKNAAGVSSPVSPAANTVNTANTGAGIMTPEQKLASLQTTAKAATGGIMYAAKGRYLQGETDGMADEIDTSIDDEQPAKLSHGEFVVPADVVSHLGNGNSDAGAKKLYQMMDKIRVARTGTKEQGKRINPDKFISAAAGGIMDVTPKRFTTGGPAAGTSTAGNLSEWVGDYATTAIGQGGAAASQPYQAYKGPLTAGPSDLQQQQFAGLSSIAQTGLAPTQYTTGTFDTTAANKYMNPYIKAALDPQLEELRRQSQINLQPNLAKLTQAGGFGGGRQAIMESEANRNLLQEQNKTVGQGYMNAYDKAMQQYNEDMRRQLQAEQAQQQANEASANFGLKSLDALGQAGATQRGIESEGLAADKAQFEEARDWDKKMAQYKMGLLQGMPVATQANTTNTNPITDWLTTGAGITELLNRFKTV